MNSDEGMYSLKKFGTGVRILAVEIRVCRTIYGLFAVYDLAEIRR